MDQQQREKIEKRGERFMMMNSATSADEKSLLGEVQRQRGQNVQLKKSIGDLQLKIDEYQKSRRELQAKVRHLEEEIDLYKYHNQRLVKRIEAMQLQDSQSSTFGTSGGASGGSRSISSSGGGGWSILGTTNTRKELEAELEVVKQELQARILENEGLHRRLATIDEEYQKKFYNLQFSTQESQRKLLEMKEELTHSMLSYEDQLLSFRRQNSELQSTINSLQLQIKSTSTSDNNNNNNNNNSDNESVLAQNVDYSERVRDLESQITILQKLLEQKDEKIAGLESTLATVEDRAKTAVSKSVETSEDLLVAANSTLTQVPTKQFADKQVGTSDEVEPVAPQVEVDNNEVMNYRNFPENSIVLVLSDYWKANDEQLGREVLLKKYYEDKFMRSSTMSPHVNGHSNFTSQDQLQST